MVEMRRPKKFDEMATWDSIASSFDCTRKKAWEPCLRFIDQLSSGEVVADFGCGNGRHLIPCAKHSTNMVVGIDFSRELLKIVSNKINIEQLGNVLLVQGDLQFLPLKSGSLDEVLYIASLHNIKGKENRIACLKETYRVLREGGRCLISVWSRWQDKYVLHFLKQLLHQRDYAEFGDITIPWKQHNHIVPRFYHLYSKREFLISLKNAGFQVDHVESTRFNSQIFADNFFAQVKKLVPQKL